MLKLALAGAVVGAITAALGDVAAGVVLGVAAMTSGALVWRKVIAPLVRLGDLLGGRGETPGLEVRLGRIEKRLDDGHESFEVMREQIEALQTPAQVAAEKATAVARELDVASREESLPE